MRWWAVLGLVWLCGAPVVAVLVGTWFARRRRRDSVAVEDATRVPEEWQLEASTEPRAGTVVHDDGPPAGASRATSGPDVLPLL